MTSHDSQKKPTSPDDTVPQHAASEPTARSKDTDTAHPKPPPPKEDEVIELIEAEDAQADEDAEQEDSEEDNEPNLTNSFDDDDIPEESPLDALERRSLKKLAEDDSFSQPKNYASIIAEEFVHARHTFKRSTESVFTSAIIAGLEIGISYVMLMTVFALLLPLVPTPYAVSLSALLYPVGFIAVVIGQSILYTEQTSLLSLPVVQGIEPVTKLLKLWMIVIIGNIIGGCLFSMTIVWLGLQMQWFEAAHIEQLADHVLNYSWWILLASAVMAGWLMGVAAWLATSARDTLSRIVLIALITACIGVLGLHHSIVGNIEVFSGLIFGSTSVTDYVVFLALALLGNTIGGVLFVTVLKARALNYDIKKFKEDIINGEE